MPSSLRSFPPTSARRGRALVELLVAALLLSIGASAALSLLQLSVTSADRVVQLAIARDVARDLAERTATSPCAAGSGADSRGRTDGTWIATARGPTTVLDLEIRSTPGPAAQTTPAALHAVVAGWCA
jgi:Tfp pilus assembly protein PilV